MTTTSRYLERKSDRSTLISRQKGLIILLALVFFLGTCSAKGGHHNGQHGGNSGHNKPGGNSVQKLVGDLTNEVKKMDGYVSALTSGKDAKAWIKAAQDGIDSERKQNSLRATLAKAGHATKALASINPLIKKIIAISEKFVRGKGHTKQSASQLAREITGIRGTAKQYNKQIIDAAIKSAGDGATKPGNPKGKQDKKPPK